MDFDIRRIPTAAIDTDDHTFLITTGSDKRDLKPSIRSTGLLQPPLLAGDDTRFTIICGFRRVSACRDLGWTSIPSRILPTAADTVERVRAAIADNAFQRSLNVVEQARAFTLIRNTIDDAAERLAVAAAAGLPDSPAIMNRLLPVARMPVAVQAGILNDKLALPVALRIERMDQDDAAAMGDFFIRIDASLNVQRELLQMITEISHRDGISIPQLLNRADLKALMDDGDLPVPQKVQRLRGLLKRMRYPAVSRAEEAYRHALKQVQLDPRIQLQPPRFFEGKTYRLTLSIESRRQLRLLQVELVKLIDHPDLLPE